MEFPVVRSMIEPLTVEERGQLLTAIVAYLNGDAISGLTGSAKIVFPIVKERIDTQTAKKAESHAKYVEAGRKGGQARAQKRASVKKSFESAPKSPPPSVAEEPVFIRIFANDGSEYPVPVSFVEEMKKLYPAVDVEQQLREMRAWSIGNPSKRKTAKGMRKFMTGWLGRAQDKGGSQPPHYNDKPKRLWDDHIPTQEEYEDWPGITIVGS